MRWSQWRADELKDLQWCWISHWYIHLHVLWKSLRFGGYLWAAGNVISHICTSPVLLIERNVLLQAFANESPKDPISPLFHCKPKNHTSKSPVMKYIEIQTWETLVFVFSYWNIFMIGPSGRCIIPAGAGKGGKGQGKGKDDKAVARVAFLGETMASPLELDLLRNCRFFWRYVGRIIGSKLKNVCYIICLG